MENRKQTDPSKLQLIAGVGSKALIDCWEIASTCRIAEVKKFSQNFTNLTNQSDWSRVLERCWRWVIFILTNLINLHRLWINRNFVGTVYLKNQAKLIFTDFCFHQEVALRSNCSVFSFEEFTQTLDSRSFLLIQFYSPEFSLSKYCSTDLVCVEAERVAGGRTSKLELQLEILRVTFCSDRPKCWQN